MNVYDSFEVFVITQQISNLYYILKSQKKTPLFQREFKHSSEYMVYKVKLLLQTY